MINNTKSIRPSWNEYFMAIAKLASTRSTCNSRPTGAVIVRDKHVLATGYNGAPPGAPHCLGQLTERGEPYCHSRYMRADESSKFDYCRAAHAEANAIAQAAQMGVSLDGASIYTTLSPCHSCMKLLAVARVREIYFERSYDSSDKFRDAYWNDLRKEYKFNVYKQILLSENTLNSLLRSLSMITSTRRLQPRSFEQTNEKEMIVIRDQFNLTLTTEEAQLLLRAIEYFENAEKKEIMELNMPGGNKEFIPQNERRLHVFQRIHEMLMEQVHS